tara:strand:+ start:738 stop:1109 length:372 start_codon:yes stop_codon:yes gene_type:complete
MKYDITHALLNLVPQAQWSISGESYSGIEWSDSSVTKPTESALNTKVDELNAAEPMRLLRIERDKRLAACDWVCAKATDTGVAVTTAWKTYRQGLRDMTTQTPKLDSKFELDLTSVTWPTEPS